MSPPHAPKIPPAMHALVMQLAEQGKNSEEIAETLFRDHRIETSSRAVRRLVRHQRNERTDVSKAVVRSLLGKFLLRNVERHERVAKQAAILATRAFNRARKLREEDKHPAARKEELQALKAMDRQLKAAGAMLDYAGLNQPDQPGQGVSTQDARKALLKRIEQLTGKPNGSAGAQAPADESIN